MCQPGTVGLVISAWIGAEGCGFSSCEPTKSDGLPRDVSPNSCFPHPRPGLPRWPRLPTGLCGSPSLVSASSAGCETVKWPNFACPACKAALSAWRSMRPTTSGTPTSAGGWGCCRRGWQRLHRPGSADRGHYPPSVRSQDKADHDDQQRRPDLNPANPAAAEPGKDQLSDACRDHADHDEDGCEP